MSAGCVCSFAVTKDGKAYGWGDGGWGGCPGVGKRKGITYANPILAGDYKKISGLDYLSNVKQIGAGRGYGVAITFDGYLLYWGNNDGNGQQQHRRKSKDQQFFHRATSFPDAFLIIRKLCVFFKSIPCLRQNSAKIFMWRSAEICGIL